MIHIDVQIACDNSGIPEQSEFKHWVTQCISADKEHTELSLRIVESNEIQMLNQQFRGKDTPTNVLSFPCELASDIPIDLLGDIVICASIVKQEANAQGKEIKAHWAHMVVHGTLHLLGYDHINDDDAELMEAKEIDILRHLGFNNPYSQT